MNAEARNNLVHAADRLNDVSREMSIRSYDGRGKFAGQEAVYCDANPCKYAQSAQGNWICDYEVDTYHETKQRLHGVRPREFNGKHFHPACPVN